MTWLRCNPLAIFLPLQAILSLWNLGLLSPWMDEAGTLMAERGSLGSLIAFAANDVHPPLFYMLLYGWLRLPLGLPWEVQARVLTVLNALMTTLAADRLLGPRLNLRARWWFLALWSLSPCLLLYGRMSRSYSLQALVTVLAVACLLDHGKRRTLLILALLLAIYTHYVPGLALLATANLMFALQRRWRDAAITNAAVLTGLLPWIWELAASLGHWSRHTGGYAVTGGAAEIVLKLGYWALSFTMGEAAPDAVLLAGALVFAGSLAMLWRGVRAWPALGWIAGSLAAIGFVAVSRWVSYPFLPARLLFLLPVFLLLVAKGADAWGRTGSVVCGALLALSLSGVWCYFHKTGFRNKQYPMPIREIATLIRDSSTAENSLIVIDSVNSDPTAMHYALAHSRDYVETGWADARDRVAVRLRDPRLRTVWFLRNTHDVSPDGINQRLDEAIRPGMKISVRGYEKFSPLETAMMRAMRLNAEPYFSELVEYRR